MALIIISLKRAWDRVSSVDNYCFFCISKCTRLYVLSVLRVFIDFDE